MKLHPWFAEPVLVTHRADTIAGKEQVWPGVAPSNVEKLHKIRNAHPVFAEPLSAESGTHPPFLRGWVPVPLVILYKCMWPMTIVCTLAELLAGFGSKLGELATAVFVTDAGIGVIEIRIVKLTVTAAPLAMFPRLH
jgi:hypothetical protein